VSIPFNALGLLAKTIHRATFEVNITKSRHKVFNWIKDADPTAERTIGVMTKCDLLAHDGLEIIGKGLFSDVSPLEISASTMAQD
jgi:hypothetical protein